MCRTFSTSSIRRRCTRATNLSLTAFVAMSVPSLIAVSIVYGELRLLTNSVWPRGARARDRQCADRRVDRERLRASGTRPRVVVVAGLSRRVEHAGVRRDRRGAASLADTSGARVAMTQGVSIPERLSKTCSERPEWGAWLVRVPGTVRELADRWALSVGEPFSNGMAAWVAPAQSSGGAAAGVETRSAAHGGRAGDCRAAFLER